ncbi:MAG: saccharopine dehydrogenase (NAD+, L-lysine-forming) [Paracoccaceae bacterium]|jgi:saccharopine dehydrogenase (NAD+, L-lysine-forming)
MQPHLWVRAEQRDAEQRVGITPDGVRAMMDAGFKVTVERSSCRAIGIEGYLQTSCEIAPENSWPNAPSEAIIFGLKELPEDDSPLPHRHILFGHAYKGQADGPALLERFKIGGGTLYDLEYLVHENGRRVAAFGYWAGYAGAAVAVKVWAAQQAGDLPGPGHINTYLDKDALLTDLQTDLAAGLGNGATMPDAIIIGALGRVGSGASDLLEALGLEVRKWDMAETASGGPFPEVLTHSIFVNCILASPSVPVFVPQSALSGSRRLSVIADVACDPNSDYNPIPIYDRATTFSDPIIRVAKGTPPLDVTAIDNLPSMLPVESSQDFAEQLLPYLLTLGEIDQGVWTRAKTIFDQHTAKLGA